MGKGWPPAEKGVRHEAAGQAVWNSDEVIVVMKRANKIGGSVAESVERRASAERSHGTSCHGEDAEPRGIGHWHFAAHGEHGAGRTTGRYTGSMDRVGWTPPSQPVSVFDSMQEPDALNAYVRKCAGGGRPAALPRSQIKLSCRNGSMRR